MSPFLPTIPPGIGALLIVLGLALMLLGHVREAFEGIDETSRAEFGVGLEHTGLAVGSTAVGYLLLTIGVLQRFDIVVPYVAFLFVVGNMITGVSHVRFCRKVAYFGRHRRLPGDFERKLRYGLATLFVVLLGGSVLVDVFASAPFASATTERVALVWTAMTIALSVIGLSKKTLPLREDVPTLLVYGFVLTITGTRVFDLTLPFELLFLVLGSVGYTVGFWIAALLWLRRRAAT